jgi:hypothetical protein
MKILAISFVTIFGIALSCDVCSQPVDAATRALKRRVVEPGGFLAAPSETARSAACQPGRGDSVVVRSTLQPLIGVRGASMLEVTILTGRCRGSVGWIGSHHVTPEDFSK